MPAGPNIRHASLTGAHLKTPRAAAVAGIVFSILLMSSLVLLRLSVPDTPSGQRHDGSGPTPAGSLSLSTWCPSRGLPFCGSLACCAPASAISRTGFSPPCFWAAACYSWPCCSSPPPPRAPSSWLTALEADGLAQTSTFTLARALSYGIMNVYAVKVAGVFMITTSTIASLHTHLGALDRLSGLRLGGSLACSVAASRLGIHLVPTVGVLDELRHFDRQLRPKSHCQRTMRRHEQPGRPKERRQNAAQEIREGARQTSSRALPSTDVG